MSMPGISALSTQGPFEPGPLDHFISVQLRLPDWPSPYWGRNQISLCANTPSGAARSARNAAEAKTFLFVVFFIKLPFGLRSKII